MMVYKPAETESMIFMTSTQSNEEHILNLINKYMVMQQDHESHPESRKTVLS